jgi:hypothetical protein
MKSGKHLRIMQAFGIDWGAWSAPYQKNSERNQVEARLTQITGVGIQAKGIDRRRDRFKLIVRSHLELFSDCCNI